MVRFITTRTVICNRCTSILIIKFRPSRAPINSRPRVTIIIFRSFMNSIIQRTFLCQRSNGPVFKSFVAARSTPVYKGPSITFTILRSKACQVKASNVTILVFKVNMLPSFLDNEIMSPSAITRNNGPRNSIDILRGIGRPLSLRLEWYNGFVIPFLNVRRSII